MTEHRLNPAMREPEKFSDILDDFKLYLRNYATHDAPVNSKRLQKQFDVNDATVRAMVHTLRTDGYPIGSGSKGFWYAREPHELDETRAHLQKRIASMRIIDAYLASAQDAMQRLPRDEKGQLKLL